MRDGFKKIGWSHVWRKTMAAFVTFATLLAMVLVSGAVSHPAQADPSDGPFDMTPWIHNVILEHRSGSTGEYTEVKPGEKVSEGDDLQFDMRFEIPQGTLKNTEAGRTVVYHLPAGITPTATSGRMEGVDGTYSISENGTITLVFDEPEVAINQNASISHGYVRFESSVNQVGGGNGGSFKFNDKNTVTVVVSQSSDLTVSKKSSNPDPKTGLVTYTVEVNSSKGTAENVVLNDVMTNNSLVGPISVTNAAGKTVTCSGTDVADDVKNFNLTCPALVKGDKYVITYQGKADALKDGAVTTGKNSITATSKDGDGNEITDKDSTDVKWDKTPDISKSDGVLNEDGTSTWTVTVNASNTDNLKGWKIEESPNKGTLTGAITVSPAINGQTTFSGFPITFGAGDGSRIYTLTYKTTPASGSTTSADTTNEAKIAPPNTDDDKKTESSGNKEVNPGSYNPLEKTGNGVTSTDNKNQVNVPWTVTIAPMNEAEKLGADWTYTDNFNCNQWHCANQYLTADQKNALEKAIKDAFNNAGFAKPEITFEENTRQSEVRYGNFTITSSDGLEVGKSITFSYATTGTVSDDALNNQWQQQYQNTGSIGKFSKTASQEYTPRKPQNVFWKVTKTDANGQSNDSAYEYRNLECAVSPTHDDYYGTQCAKPYLHWKVKVDQQVARADTADYTLSDLTITENLPVKLELLQGEGLNASGLTLSMWNVNDTVLNIPEDGQSAQTQVTLSGWPLTVTYNYAVTVARQGNALSITIPADLLTKIRDTQKDLGWDVRNSITLDVRAGFDSSIDTSKSWKDAKVFANTASLKDASGKDYGESKQSQTISKNDDWNAVQKSHGEIANGTNAIPYSVTVNPKGNTLNEGKPLTLTDKLTYTHESSRNKFNVTLKDITVYEYDANAANHRGKRLTADKWSFSLDEQKGDGNRANTLTVTVPDSTPLVIAYTYQYSGVLGSSVDISNTASMEGVSTSGDKVQVKVHQSSAGSKRSIITVTKADSGNQNIALKGAKFDLYRWDKDKKQYVNVHDENSHLVTGDDGKLTFSTSKIEQTQPCSGASGTTCSSASVKYNTAYMLKEVEAPEGYELSDQAYYFMLVDDTDTNFVAPDNFEESNKHYNGDNVFFLNTKKTPGLPSTGGEGLNKMYAAGFLAVAIAVAGLALSLRRRQS